MSHSTAMKLGGLAGILLFSFWVGMSPHWNYPYPLHVDEWIHIGLAQGVLGPRRRKIEGRSAILSDAVLLWREDEYGSTAHCLGRSCCVVRRRV